MYERVSTEGVIWGIDFIDQSGPIRGNILARTIEGESPSDAAHSLDRGSCATALIRRHRTTWGRAS
jgi:hypothetical protein